MGVGREVVGVRYLRIANGPGVARAWSPRSSKKDVCLIDYASCAGSDVCWLLDIESDCMSNDGCIVDT